MKKFSFFLLGLLVFSGLTAQDSHRFQIPPSGSINISEVEVDYFPHLQRIQKPFPGGQEAQDRLEQAKREQAERYQGNELRAPSQKTDAGGLEPWMGSNFRSNIAIQGVPNDNDIAVGGNFVVSVINSNIWVHDRAGNVLQTISLEAWSDTLTGVSQDQFDPRALYDPIHDRFIIVCLAGFTDSTNNIIAGFSATNDPTADWNMYALPGDPLDDTLWTDYPIVAITEYELFVTGNLLRNGEPWQTGFDKSICWQIDLDNAYAGDTLDTRLWVKPEFGGAPIRNLCPVQGGVSPAGPNMYLLSNRNFALSNDTVFLMEITDTLNGNPTLTVDFVLANVPYGVPTNAPQVISQRLATNDSRWLDAFIENDNIQFVGNTIDTLTGLPGVYHGIIRAVSQPNPSVDANVLRDDTVGYGYAGITWFGLSYTDDDALIGINYSGPFNTKHPGCGVIFSNGQGIYSDLVVARRGFGFINAIADTTERWGDYSGMQLDYGPTLGRAWMSGTWGQSSHIPATWVAEFNHPGIVSRPETPPARVEARAFPNPFTDMVAIEFRLDYEQALEIGLYDLQGKRVQSLLHTRGKAGLNRFSFSQKPLPAGMYLLRIDGESGQIASKKLVKQ